MSEVPLYLGLKRSLSRFDLLLAALVLLKDPLRVRHHLILLENSINSKLSSDEVSCTHALPFRIKIMLCSKRHCQNFTY